MTLAKETEREKDAPKAREAIYLLLDLVSEEIFDIHYRMVLYQAYCFSLFKNHLF